MLPEGLQRAHWKSINDIFEFTRQGADRQSYYINAEKLHLAAKAHINHIERNFPLDPNERVQITLQKEAIQNGIKAIRDIAGEAGRAERPEGF